MPADDQPIAKDGDPIIQWDWGTAYDFFISLHVLHKPNKFGLRGAWAAGVRSRLPDADRELLDEYSAFLHWPLKWIHQLPDPKDENVYSLIKADLEEFPDKAVFMNIITPWGVIAEMRTYERVYMDMYEYADEFKKLSRRIADIMNVAVERACKMGVTAIYIQEDFATSQGLSMSPQMIKEFGLDFAKGFVEIAKAYDKPVVFHSDGMIRDLIEPLKEFGVHAINPLQPNVNDIEEFKKRFGNSIGVYGGLDNCFVIPEGTPSQIKEHVLNSFNVLGKPDGSLIFSTHDIPLETPKENIEEIVRTIKQECLY